MCLDSRSGASLSSQMYSISRGSALYLCTKGCASDAAKPSMTTRFEIPAGKERCLLDDVRANADPAVVRYGDA